MTIQSLPIEVLTTIVSLVDSPADLLSLALTSSAWAALIIPHHIEYRTLHLRNRHPELWAHLAERRDLASRIRTVVFDERCTEYFWPSNVPRSLVSQSDTPVDLLLYSANIAQGLRNMESLESFRWKFRDFPLDPASPLSGRGEIFRALAASRSLVDLWLDDSSGTVAGGLEPLWAIKDLRRLYLVGDRWERHMPSIMPMVSTFKFLQELSLTFSLNDLPVNSLRLSSLRLPVLQKLIIKHLPLPVTGAVIASFNSSFISFINAHSSISSLSWFPLCPAADSVHPAPHSQVPPGFLPSLREIFTKPLFLLKILEDFTVHRPLETLHSFRTHTFDATMLIRRCKPFQTVKMLVAPRVLRPAALADLGRIFPNLTFASFGKYAGFAHGDGDESDDSNILTALSAFPHLETLASTELWLALLRLGSVQRKQDFLNSLLETCPKLKKIYHYYPNSHRTVAITIWKEPNGVVAWKETPLCPGKWTYSVEKEYELY